MLYELCHEPLSHDDGEEHRFVLAVPPDLPLFPAHFPRSPILPGFVELLEVLSRAQRLWPELVPWRGAPMLKFQAPIRPGVRLELRLRRLGAWQVRFSITATDDATMSYAGGTLVFGPAADDPSP